MAPPIRATNEDIQKAAESFQEAFASFHVVHKLRKEGLIGKGEDDIASRKVNAWLKAQVTLGAYVLAGKFGPSNKYARLTPEYLEKKKAAKEGREAIEQLKQRFLNALAKVIGGEASLQNGGEMNGVPCFKMFIGVEQVKQLTEILEAHPAFNFVPPPDRSDQVYPADCGSCRGYGHFDEDGKPTTDKRCRKCLDCNGTGEHQP